MAQWRVTVTSYQSRNDPSQTGLDLCNPASLLSIYGLTSEEVANFLKENADLEKDSVVSQCGPVTATWGTVSQYLSEDVDLGGKKEEEDDKVFETWL